MNKLACRSLEVHVFFLFLWVFCFCFFFESSLVEHNFVQAFGKWFDVRYPELSNAQTFWTRDTLTGMVAGKSKYKSGFRCQAPVGQLIMAFRLSTQF